MKHQNRILTGTLSIALALSLTSPAAFAATLEFSDVPTTHWAYSSITRMVEQGVMQGVGNNRFAPEQDISRAEFTAMLVRQFYPDEIQEGVGGSWYDPYIQVANNHYLFWGGVFSNGGVKDTLTRGEAAVQVNRFLRESSAAIRYSSVEIGETEALRAELRTVPIDAKYYECNEEEIARVVYTGIMSGVDSKGTFNPYGTMTRAQAVAVLDRIIDYCANAKTDYPTGETDEVIYITSAEQEMVTIEGNCEFDKGIWHLGTENPGSICLASYGDYCAVTGVVTTDMKETGIVLECRYLLGNKLFSKQSNISYGDIVDFSFEIPELAGDVSINAHIRGNEQPAEVSIANLKLIKSEEVDESLYLTPKNIGPRNTDGDWDFKDGVWHLGTENVGSIAIFGSAGHRAIIGEVTTNMVENEEDPMYFAMSYLDGETLRSTLRPLHSGEATRFIFHIPESTSVVTLYGMTYQNKPVEVWISRLRIVDY